MIAGSAKFFVLDFPLAPGKFAANRQFFTFRKIRT